MPVRGRISVLVVEHGSENLNWVEEHLMGLDVDLFWASSGCEVLSLAPENDFVMALVGINNRENGIETAKLIQSHQITQHLPIIFVSNGPDKPALPLNEIGTGIVDYLTKPIEPFMLRNKLHLFRELYHQRKSARQHISELRATHIQLRKSKERYRRLLASVTSYVYSVTVCDGAPISTTHGQGCEAVTGFSPEEYAADPELWFGMIPTEDRPEVLDATERILNAATPLTVEHRILHKDGRIHWVRNTLVPHFDLEGALVSYDGIIIDITERKSLEEQLRQAQKMEAVGQMAGGIAHDFNNILTVILGYGCALQESFDRSDPRRENIDRVLAAAERAANLTRSLLVFSSKQVMAPQVVGLNETVRNFETLIRRVIGEDIRFKAIYSPDRLKVYADSGQIEQVLMNLAANARDAMPNGGVLVMETLSGEIDDSYVREHGYGEIGKYAIIRITDNGMGMDEETRRRVFEPFFTTKEMGRGTGLGLSIVYGIVKHHKGFIDVISKPGKETTFTIYLPLLEMKEDAYEKPVHFTFRGGNETILLAEDDDAIRVLLAGILRNAGYNIIEARDGVEAVECFHEHREEIHLFVSDLIMPRKNGKEARDEIMAHCPAIRTLFMSGYPAENLYERGIMEERIELVLKPIVPMKLLRKVRDVLDGDTVTLTSK